MRQAEQQMLPFDSIQPTKAEEWVHGVTKEEAARLFAAVRQWWERRMPVANGGQQ